MTAHAETVYTVWVDDLNPGRGRMLVEEGESHARYYGRTTRFVRASSPEEAQRKAVGHHLAARHEARYGRSR